VSDALKNVERKVSVVMNVGEDFNSLLDVFISNLLDINDTKNISISVGK
jgi:hypothetical protein